MPLMDRVKTQLAAPMEAKTLATVALIVASLALLTVVVVSVVKHAR